MATRELAIGEVAVATLSAQRRFGLLLGLIAMPGPLAINLYVPALSDIAKSLSTAISTVRSATSLI